MGREIKRVPLDFDFPVGDSYADAQWERHRASCSLEEHDDCDYSFSPPKGDGWQLWQTVSDGPISPVFATPEQLIDFMCQPDHDNARRFNQGQFPPIPWAKGWTRATAESFVRREGSMPSMITVGGRVLTTAEIEADCSAEPESNGDGR